MIGEIFEGDFPFGRTSCWSIRSEIVSLKIKLINKIKFIDCSDCSVHLTTRRVFAILSRNYRFYKTKRRSRIHIHTHTAPPDLRASLALHDCFTFSVRVCGCLCVRVFGWARQRGPAGCPLHLSLQVCKRMPESCCAAAVIVDRTQVKEKATRTQDSGKSWVLGVVRE